MALRVVRRHRLVETLLYQQVGVPWDEVHEEAERLEHAVSERLEGYLDRALGYPTHDPHGNPIPAANQPAEVEQHHLALADAPVGQTFLVRRVSDANPAGLRRLADHGLLPNVTLTVLKRDPFAGPTWLQVAGKSVPHPLPAALARDVFGDLVESPEHSQPNRESLRPG